MKARAIVVTLIALVAIGVTSFWAYRYEQKREVNTAVVELFSPFLNFRSINRVHDQSPTSPHRS